MTVFKCKMCGGTIDFQPGDTVGVCEYCGTKQTLPKIDDERKANLYERANHFRRANDFDRAMAIYEQILDEDISDAEAYWSLVLCRYGIEYVEDPTTHKRVPTVNRVQYTSIFADEDYKAALSHADIYQQVIYEEEAKAIDEIQKGILAISEKEEPFDIFICYKETDNNGRRTEDSVLAYDIYKELTKEGYKVFFSRVTLEDKLGTAYEPYIFAALNSSKIMIAVGTKAEFYNAVWVKNEWSRYLALIKKGAKKTLIPAYKGIDPYDLPEEFSHLQGQDMSKLGFMQDLVRGVKKILGESEVRKITDAEIVPLMEKANEYLEAKDWKNAKEYYARVIDIDARHVKANLGVLLAEQKVTKEEELSTVAAPFDETESYTRAIRYADEDLINRLKGYCEEVRKKYSKKKKKAIKLGIMCAIAMIAILIGLFWKQIMNTSIAKYTRAGILYNNEQFDEAITVYRSLGNYKDSKQQIQNCEKGKKYLKGIEQLEAGNYEDALAFFWGAGDYKDATEKYQLCQEKVNEKTNLALEEARKAVDAALTATDQTNNLIDALKILYPLQGDAEIDQKITEYERTILENAEVGDTVVLGHIEQDNNATNGEEPIEWNILRITENNGKKRYLVISSLILADKQYNNSGGALWTVSLLAKWLNNSFLTSSFSTWEQSIMFGNSSDKVFILNTKQAEDYYSSNELRKCKATTFVNETGNLYSENGFVNWWLRPDNSNSYGVGHVGVDGDIGGGLAGEIYGVRPAIWIELDQ